MRSAHRLFALAAPLIAAGALLVAVPRARAQAASASGTLTYTTFRLSLPIIGDISDATLKSVSYTYDGTTFTLGTPVTIHDWGQTSGADGLVFAPDGDILVGGTDANVVHKVKASDGTFTDVGTGNNNAFHMALDPSGQRAYAMGEADGDLPGPVTVIDLNPFGTASNLTVNGDNSGITGLAFDGTGQAFYTAALGNNPLTPGLIGVGDFGSIDLDTGLTTRTLASMVGLHGLTFDPFTHDLFAFGGNTVLQIDPSNSAILSTLDLSALDLGSFVLDAGTTDGLGHLFVGDNNGKLLFVDFSSSGLIGQEGNFVSAPFLETSLDDVAPLVGPGSSDFEPPTPPPAPVPLPNAAAMAIAGLSAAAAVGGMRRRRQQSQAC